LKLFSYLNEEGLFFYGVKRNLYQRVSLYDWMTALGSMIASP